MTLFKQWIDVAAAHGGDAAYLEDAAGARKLSYAGLQRSTRTWARLLDRAGVAPGARVAIWLPDPLGYASALVSILVAGRVAVPLDPAAPPVALARMIEVARPAAVVCDGSSGLPPGLPVLRPPGPGGAKVPPGPPPAASAGGIFLCTSGTTGTPKGILLSADQLAHVAACVAAHHRLTPADRGYCCLPLFHINAEVVGLLATLAARACLVLDGKFSRRGFWAMIEERQVTWINAVPAIITILAMDLPEVRPPSRVRFVRSASAPLPPSALRRFEGAFGIPVIETYGMTEAASMITANPLDGPRKPGSAGLPAAAEVRIVERAGAARADGLGQVRAEGLRERYRRCPPGAIGRVQIRGPGVITGYAAGPAGAIDADGWLDTGDLGHVDRDGYLFLAGRADDVINRGGEKIHPREIEDFLLAQPGVRSAVVVAARDEVLGERPVAYVIPAGPEDDQLEEALRAACAAALPRPKRPDAFYLVRELPLGPTGKVTRGRLRELAAAAA